MISRIIKNGTLPNATWEGVQQKSIDPNGQRFLLWCQGDTAVFTGGGVFLEMASCWGKHLKHSGNQFVCLANGGWLLGGSFFVLTPTIMRAK